MLNAISGRKAHFFIARDDYAGNRKSGVDPTAHRTGGTGRPGSGIEILEVDLRGAGKARLLRVYIDKPGGVTHGDCEFISQRLGELIDREDVVPGERLHA